MASIFDLHEEPTNKLDRNQLGSFSLKRLLKDYREVLRNPLQSIAAEPLPNNMYEWHVNMVAPEKGLYQGVVFHLVFNFQVTYPQSPPKVRLCTLLKHPHVFHGYICLDMYVQKFLLLLPLKKQQPIILTILSYFIFCLIDFFRWFFAKKKTTVSI